MAEQGVDRNGAPAHVGTLIDLTGDGGQAQTQTAAVTPAKGSQIRLNEREKLELVRNAVRNADIYRQAGSRRVFWDTMSTFCQESLGLPLKNPDRVLKKLVDAQRKKASENLLASGVAVAVTDLEQAVQVWIEIIDDEEALQAEKKGAKDTQEDEARRVASVARHNLMHRQTQKRTLDDVEKGDGVGDDEPNKRRSTSGNDERISKAAELARMRQLLEEWQHKATGAGTDGQQEVQGHLQRHDTEIENLKERIMAQEARINAQDALIRDLIGMLMRQGRQ